RRRADRMQRAVVLRCQHRCAAVALQCVGDAEFLAEPDDPFGLRSEMMDGEHGLLRKTLAEPSTKRMSARARPPAAPHRIAVIAPGCSAPKPRPNQTIGSGK